MRKIKSVRILDSPVCFAVGAAVPSMIYHDGSQHVTAMAVENGVLSLTLGDGVVLEISGAALAVAYEPMSDADRCGVACDSAEREVPQSPLSGGGRSGSPAGHVPA